MRFRRLLLPLLAVPIALGGCGVLGSAGAPGPAATATPDAGGEWLVLATGSATPSPVPSAGASRAPVLPPPSFLPVPSPGCAEDWTVKPPLIPLKVVPGVGRLTVTWPRQYDSDYRITAVKQELTFGEQPAYTWQNVPAGTDCMITATITGLTKGMAYIVWLDAPNSGHERDGTRHPYSGRSGVVYPL